MRSWGRTVCGGFWPTGCALTHVPELAVLSQNEAKVAVRQCNKGRALSRVATTHPLLADSVHIGDGVQPGAGKCRECDESVSQSGKCAREAVRKGKGVRAGASWWTPPP